MQITHRDNVNKPTTAHILKYAYLGIVAWCSSNTFHPIDEVTLHQAGLVL